jgi:hypothetical protein
VVRDRGINRCDLPRTGLKELRIGVTVRVSNDGVALRYRLTEATKLDDSPYKERTEFAFPAAIGAGRGEPSACAENAYPKDAQRDSARGAEGVYAARPLLVQTPAGVRGR